LWDYGGEDFGGGWRGFDDGDSVYVWGRGVGEEAGGLERD